MLPSAQLRFALTLKFDSRKLRKLYKPATAYQNAYRTVASLLEHRGFCRRGKLYVGGEGVTEADCRRAVRYLNRKLKWFAGSLKYLHLIPVFEPIDLMPTLTKRG